MNILWYFAFFLVSGFCSLVYETVWLRLIMAAFGVTTPTVSVVLSVFMAGLALGSWGGGKLVRRLEPASGATLIRVYGVIELVIGASALAVPHLINLGHELMRGSGNGLVWDSSGYYFASGSWIALCLLPWCTCMGATLPLGMAAIRKTVAGKSQHSFSYLYLSNIVGAILGTLIPTFLLIEMLGFRGSLRVASLLNGILAASAFAVSLGRLAEPQRVMPVAEHRAPAKLYDLPTGTIFGLLFITGVCSMAMEVIWIRLFTVYLGNVVYSFATILALYLGATYVGSQRYRFWVRRHDPQESVNVWIVLGLLSLLPLLFADPAVRIPLLVSLSGQTISLDPLFRTALGVVPLSAALGFLTPMLVDHFSAGEPDRAGRAYAVNVLGSIAGPLLAGFWILPWLGEHWGLVGLSLPLFGCGLLITLQPARDAAIPRTGFGHKVGYAAVVLLAIPLVAVTKGYEAGYGSRVELRDHTATVIAAGQGMKKILLVNGVGMTTLTPIAKYMAHLPLALMDRPPRNGLVICFGMGTTFRSMLSWGIESTAVDLVPSVPKLFGYYHPDGPELLKSPLARVVVDDGRRFLERSSEKYDVITLDPPPPISTPTTGLLFSSEFYAKVSEHLRPGGIVHVWVYVADTRWDPAFPAAAAKALQVSFPYTRAYVSLGRFGFHILASNDPLPEIDARTLANRMPAKAAADFVEWGPALTPELMFQAVIGQEAVMEKIAGLAPRVPPIQDDQPINEYFFLRRALGYYK